MIPDETYRRIRTRRTAILVAAVVAALCAVCWVSEQDVKADTEDNYASTDTDPGLWAWAADALQKAGGK